MIIRSRQEKTVIVQRDTNLNSILFGRLGMVEEPVSCGGRTWVDMLIQTFFYLNPYQKQ